MVVETSKGPMDEKLLIYTGYANEGIVVVEYYHDGELVHRSVKMRLVGAQAAATAKM